MRKFFILILSLIPLSSFAQEWEFGIFGGVPLYNGELTNDRLFVWEESHPGFGMLMRHNFNENVSLKSNIYYGEISGDDANAASFEDRVRNLHFKSDILDISVQAEINFMGFWTTDKRKRTSLYGLFGVSVFRFNPMAKYNDKWYQLQPLGTEGQGTTKFNDRKKYALTQLAIPYGLGFKHAFNDHWSIGLELGFRHTFTDYLDDVSKSYVSEELLTGAHGKISYELSNRTDEILEEGRNYDSRDQRGDPTNNDSYHFVGLTLTYTVVPSDCFKF